MCAGFELFQNLGVAVFQIDAIDLVTGHHNVVYGDLLEIEDIDQHAAVTAWN